MLSGFFGIYAVFAVAQFQIFKPDHVVLWQGWQSRSDAKTQRFAISQSHHLQFTDILIGHFCSLPCHSSPRTCSMNEVNPLSFAVFAVSSLAPQMIRIIKPTQCLCPRSPDDLN